MIQTIMKPRTNMVVVYDDVNNVGYEFDVKLYAEFLKAKPVKQQKMLDENVTKEIKKICSELHSLYLTDGDVNEKLKFLIDYLIECKEIDVVEVTEKFSYLISPAEALYLCNTIHKFNYLTYSRTFDDIRFKIISELLEYYEDIDNDENFEHL